MRRFAVLAFIGLAACDFEAVDRASITDFTITPTGFTYSAPADMTRPLDTPEGEANRMAMLNAYLADNGLCPAGYRITSRNAVVTVQGALGTGYEVTYTGECA